MSRVCDAALTDAPPVFFVTGVPRSGTTWMQRLLNAHPDLGCFGEADVGRVFFRTIEIALHDYNKHCEADNPEKNLPINGLSQAARLKLMQLSFFALAEENLEGDIGSYKAVGEKSTDSIEDLPALHMLFPNAKFIHVIRDGRDAAVSGWWKFAHKGDQVLVSLEEYAGMYADAWDTRIRKALEFKKKFPDFMYEVRYENMIEQPFEGLSDIVGFLGGSTAKTDIDLCLEAAKFEALSGGRKAGETEHSSHFRRGVSGAWKDEMSDAAVAAFTDRAGDLLTELGYVG